MQVSWIEPDEVRALAALLQGTHPGGGTSGGWDVQTLPDAPQLPPQPLLSQDPEPQNAPEVPTAASAPVQAQPQQPSADVVLIREKLRVIRDRAKQAGLIQDEPAAVPQPQPRPAPAVPLDAPMAPPAPSGLSPFPPLSSLRPEAPAPSAAPAFLPLEGAITERLENFARWAARFTGCSELLLLDDHGDLLWGAPTQPGVVVATMLAVQQALRASAGSIHQPPSVLQLAEGEVGPVHALPCSTRYGLVTVVLVGIATLAEASVAALREALVLSVEAGGS
ncbi:MAG: hypothetical protein ACAH88_21645 [Roseimicrobium sp.]